jgi:hypothetical protein
MASVCLYQVLDENIFSELSWTVRTVNLGQANSTADIQCIYLFFPSQLIISDFCSSQMTSCFFIGFTLQDVDLHSFSIIMLQNKGKYTQHRPVWTEEWVHCDWGSLQWACCLSALFYAMRFVCCWQHPGALPDNHHYTENHEDIKQEPPV